MKRIKAVMIGIILVFVALSNTYATSYTYTPLNYPGASATEAVGINNAGTIVGAYGTGTTANGFSLSGGIYTTLTYPSALYTGAAGINNAGTIVGGYVDASGVEHGFSLRGGTYTPLNYPGASATEAIGINNAGTIVGEYVKGTTVNGFSLSGGIYTTLTYPSALDTGAAGINDAGWIVGEYLDASDVTHGFVATPVPLPASVFLLGSGLIPLAWARRKKWLRK
jgi:uncharacterized membrane protein